MTMRTIFSGIKPTGHLTLGNYLGALGRFVELQHEATCVFSIVDLHAMTVDHSPERLRMLTREAATIYLAAGLDPDVCVVVRQSAVGALHTELMYLMESTAYIGELQRMIQYKEKGRGRPKTRASLLTYPTLMAADILLYGTTHVPVGDDQKQHVELTRDLALRFNRLYGEVFVVPAMMDAAVAARVMDLQEPTKKMMKSGSDDSLGQIRLLDPPEVVRRKVQRAVTDSEGVVRVDREDKPGLTNLLEILAAATGQESVEELACRYASYGQLKRDVADAVVAVLEPLQKSYADLANDPAAVDAILAAGADRARELGTPYLTAAKEAMGVG